MANEVVSSLHGSFASNTIKRSRESIWKKKKATNSLFPVIFLSLIVFQTCSSDRQHFGQINSMETVFGYGCSERSRALRYIHTGQIALGGFYTNEHCKYLKVESKKW